MQARLRRLDAKLQSGQQYVGFMYVPMTTQEINRCRYRAHQLADAIQTHPDFYL